MDRRRLVFACVLLAIVAVVLWSRQHTGRGVVAAYDGKAELVAATFSSAWCGACRILKPRLVRVIPEFDGAPVRFVEYDFTFGEREEIAAKAAADGLADVYGRFAGATGFTLLVDAGSGEIIDMLTINHSDEAIHKTISDALAVAAAADRDEP